MWADLCRLDAPTSYNDIYWFLMAVLDERERAMFFDTRKRRGLVGGGEKDTLGPREGRILTYNEQRNNA
jgi:hypothetical protein